MNVESVFGRLRRKYLSSAAARPAAGKPRLKVESLEARDVPATLPAPVIDYTTTRSIVPDTFGFDATNGSQAPTIAQDPLNPNNLFGAVVKRLTGSTQSRITMIYSNNGGATWVGTQQYVNGMDPETSTPGNNIQYANVSNPSVAFDRFHNAFLTYTEHSANAADGSATSGRVVLRKYNFAGTPQELNIGLQNPASPANQYSGHTLYTWVGSSSDGAYNPTVGVNNNEAVTLPDPDTSEVQTDQIAATQTTADAVKVFVAWNTIDVTPAGAGGFIKNVIRMTTSSDAGVNFSPINIVNNNDHFNFDATSYSAPKIIFTPGRVGQANAGGRMVTVYSDAANVGSPSDRSLISDVYTFDGATAPVTFEAVTNQFTLIPGSTPLNTPTIYTLDVPAGSGITSLGEMSVRVGIQHNDAGEIRLRLRAPAFDDDNDPMTPSIPGPSIILLQNYHVSGTRTFAGGVGAGGNLGITDTGAGDNRFAMGTVFSDNAGRDIDDGTNTAPYVSEYRPDNGKLSGPAAGAQPAGSFYGLTPAQFEGTWTLEIEDFTPTSLAGVPFQNLPRINEMAFKLSQNFDFADNVGTDHITGLTGVTPNNPSGTVHPNSTPTLPVATPGVGFGAGLSVAVDNSQGSFSPYQNRIYAAYTTGGTVRVAFSDDQGRKWTTAPSAVGAGFNPAITVDPTTGTVLVSYYSTAQDPAGTRAVTMLSTSVNGPAFTASTSTPQGTVEFSQGFPVNPVDTVYDQITGKTIQTEVVSSNGPGMGSEAFGNNMGLVSYSGNVSLVYAGNLDRQVAQARTQRIHIAGGPRIVKADTGAILTTATTPNTFNTPVGATVTYNGPAATGQAQFTGFFIEFDRVISQIDEVVTVGNTNIVNSLNPEDIKIIYRTPGSDPAGNGEQITPLSIRRIDKYLDPVPANGGHVPQDYGSKRFFVEVAPRTQAGTYSYVVGPLDNYEGDRFGETHHTTNPTDDPLAPDNNVIRDRIRYTSFALVPQPLLPTDTYNSVDHAAPGPFGSGPTPIDIDDRLGNVNGGATSTIVVPPAGPGEVVERVTVKVNITHDRTSDLRLRLTSPSGQTVELMSFDDSEDNDDDQISPTPDTLKDLVNTVFADNDPTTTADDANTTIADDDTTPDIPGAPDDDLIGPPYTGTFIPVNPLGIYFGSRIDGSWTLSIVDDTAGGEGPNQDGAGVLDGWEITIKRTLNDPTVFTGNFIDQDNDGNQAEFFQDVFSVPTAVDNHPFVLPYVPEAKPITVPGPRVVGSRPLGQAQTADNLVLNTTASALDIEFDRTMNAGTFTTADILRITGPLGDLPLTGLSVVSIPALGAATTTPGVNSRFFRIGFPTQQLAGQYQIQLSADIFDTSPSSGPLNPPDPAIDPPGTAMDPDVNAGVNVLVNTGNFTATKDVSAGGVFQTGAVGVPQAPVAVLGKSSQIISLTVTGDAFLVRKALANVTVKVPGGNLKDLEARLVSPDGSRSVLLFNNSPANGVQTTADNVTFTDDKFFRTVTNNIVIINPVQSGFAGAGGFNLPVTALAALNGANAKGGPGQAWRLVIRNKGTATATVEKFALTLTKADLASGAGDTIADQTSVGFRIFQADGGVGTAKANWNPAGPDGNTTGEPLAASGAADIETTAGRVSNVQIDPADPSGNTVYAAGASGGLWRTSNFLTREVGGPTWVPLTDFGANEVIRDPVTGLVTRYGSAINIETFALFNETGNPKDTKIMVGTGSNALNVLDQSVIGDPTDESTRLLPANPGEDNNRYDGVGFLYSEDAGKTWNILDSRVNYGTPTGGTGFKYLTVGDAQRDHSFVGTVINKIVFERKIVANANLPIIYAAVGRGSTPAAENMAGLWRSVNGGRTWLQIEQGEATDFAIGEGSAQLNTANRPTVGYLAIQGVGILTTNNLNAADVNAIDFDATPGGGGRPTINNNGVSVVTNGTPNGANGRIQIVTPRYLPNEALKNNYYQDWMVAAVSTAAGRLDGVYVTKDQGDNWTRINLNVNGGFADFGNDIETLNFPINDWLSDSGNNHSIALAMDPIDPNILYLGGDRLIRIDMTLINDPYKLQLNSHTDNTGQVYTADANENSNSSFPGNGGGGGLVALDTTRGNPALPSATPTNDAYDLDLRAERRRVWNFINLKFDPYEPTFRNTSLTVTNTQSFLNNGNDVVWKNPQVGRNAADAGAAEQGADFDFVSSIVTFVDPLTGRGRVAWGHDEGVGTFVSNDDGALNRVDGFDQRGADLTGPGVTETNLQVEGPRNGNLQVARLYSGDAQPSLLAASISHSLLLGAARRLGDVYGSSEAILQNGSLTYDDVDRNGRANYIAADKTGTGTVYILRRIDDIRRARNETTPADNIPTEFFQVQLPGGGRPIGRATQTLFTPLNGGFGQWSNEDRRFAVNPIDANGILLPSGADLLDGAGSGRLFFTNDQGLNWSVAADPAELDGSYVMAPAFGSPVITDPGDPSAGISNYQYAGTRAGNIWVRTQTALAPNWVEITTAPDGSTLDGAPVLKIVPNPTRGSNGLYAVTENGVYFMRDWTSTDPLVNTWVNVTGNLFDIKHNAFGKNLGTDFQTTLLRRLSAIAVDWRPFTAPTPGLPILYAAGDGGVFRSTDNGAAWVRFAGDNFTTTPVEIGGLPTMKVTDIDLVLGNIDSGTGRTNSAGSPDMLVATTMGRGIWTLALGVPDGVTGPKVVPEKTTPNGPVSAPFTEFTVEFDSFIAKTSFTAADVTIVRPDGTLVPTAGITVTEIAVADPDTLVDLENIYRVSFPGQTQEGAYTITVGPNITSGGGTPMNQDGDLVNGEPVTAMSVGDAYRFVAFVGASDISDFVTDAYVELLGAPADPAATLKRVTALTTARQTALAVVVKELLSGYDPVTKSYGDDTARRQMISRLWDNGGAAGEIGNFLPAFAPTPTALTLLIADIRAGRKTPETITIDILSSVDYYQKGGNTTPEGFLNNLYADLFPNRTINAATDRPTLPYRTYATQLTQANEAVSRKALVTAIVNGGINSVSYDDDGVGGGTTLTKTDYRSNFVDVAFQQVLGRAPVSSTERNAYRTVMGYKAVNGLSGSENVYAKLLANKEFFNAQLQAELASPLGDPADNLLHTNRSWVEGVIAERFFGRTDVEGDGLKSTDAERDAFSDKILNNVTFKAARLSFLRSVALSAPYKTIQVEKAYQLVHNRPTASAVEVSAGIKYTSIPNLIAGRLASKEFSDFNGGTLGVAPPGGSPPANTVEASENWAVGVYVELFNINASQVTPQARVYLANYSRAYGRLRAAQNVLNAVDGADLATASKFTPVGGSNQTYREKILIPQTFQDVLGRTPSAAEVTKYITYLKVNRWEYFTTDLMMSREFYEIIG